MPEEAELLRRTWHPRVPTRRSLAAAAAAAVAAGAVLAWGAVALAKDHAPPLNVSVDGDFVFGPCPAGDPAGDSCLTDHVTGNLPGAGPVSGDFAVHIGFSAFGTDGCGEIDKHGTFQATGGTITLAGSGLYCRPNSTAAYQFRVVGGTGRYRHAHGSGIWLVPPPATFDNGAGTGPEYLYGTFDAG